MSEGRVAGYRGDMNLDTWLIGGLDTWPFVWLAIARVRESAPKPAGTFIPQVLMAI